MSDDDKPPHRDRAGIQPLGPVLIEFDPATPPPDVGAAPPVDPDEPPQGRAMQGAIARMGRPASGWVKLFWGAMAGFLTLVLGLAAWDFAAVLMARVPWLGWLAVALLAVLVAGLVVTAANEALGYRRLRRLDRLRARADAALAAQDLGAAQDLAAALAALYAAPQAQAWVGSHPQMALDADAVLEAAEGRFLLALDARAVAEIEAAARQVALITALVPVALADVAAALLGNLRMIRRIAEIYGGRAGFLGNWRLARSVIVHLVATGVVAVGDDMIGSLAGGGVVSKVSRRFGEGVVNGALTARVGISAMEVCRPLPFRIGRRPGVSAVLSRALKGAFSRA